ncbi:MAG TPA: phosphate signaling complex protein PhoU [Actinomycetota bacterium]|nr:phosphate signaling complex protein PhoU [Actinomycetota bacterium]
MRKAFRDELAEVETLCVEVAGQVLQQLEKAMQALLSFDEELGDEVVRGDDPIDRCYMEIRNRIFTLLATQAPVAVDLRLVAAMLHINMHLERMGDLCTTIGKVVRLVKDLPPSEAILGELKEMGAQAGRMIDAAFRAFSSRDLTAALGLSRMDDSIDRLNRGLIKEVAKVAADDETTIEWAARMVLVSRQLERLGDHAVDIGEEVAFLVTGEFKEFTDASHKGDIPGSRESVN